MTDECAVKVAVRERPSRYDENSDGKDSMIGYHGVNSNIIIVDERPFVFDYVAGPKTSQEELFECLVKPLVDKVLLGFNCTALAYGQTGTGKSYSMGLNSNPFKGQHVGLIPRCLQQIFSYVSHANEQPIAVSVSFIEIYNEKVYDLLSENSNLPIAARGYKFTGGSRTPLASIEECYNLLNLGNKNRHIRPTKMNLQSSRSHAIFTIHANSIRGDSTTSGCLNLVDLAGSEGVRRTGHEGLAKSEGVHINQGLLCIGKVLQAMAAGNKVIPYRDSVLSSVLQDSLSPNSYLTLLACISPHQEDLCETLSTLRFAQNAKQIKRTPQVNTILKDIKRNHTKTPYRTNTLSVNQNYRNLVQSKQIYSLGITSDKLYTDGAAGNGHHSNTFCTPTNNKRINANKFNHSEMGLTPKEKQKVRMGIIRPTVSKQSMVTATANQFGTISRGGSLLDCTNDSIISLNVSTSTTMDVPATATSSSLSYSPVMRKFLVQCETVMENKLQQLFEKLCRDKDDHCRSSIQSGVSGTHQVINNTIRHELKTIMQELINNGNDVQDSNKKTNTPIISSFAETPANEDISRKLFMTSSPVFKIPEVPTSNKIRTKLQLSFDSKSDTSDTSEIVETCNERSKTLRRSRRISEINRSKIDENCVSFTSQANHNGMSKSVKELYEIKHRNVRLAAHLEEPTPSKDSDGVKSRKRKSRTSSIKLNNSFIASYFDNSTEIVTSKKKSLVNHRKAVLELLNKGNMKELQVLPQIGQKTAYQILTQRTLHGKFKNLKQVEKLPIWRGNSWERFAQANILV